MVKTYKDIQNITSKGTPCKPLWHTKRPLYARTSEYRHYNYYGMGENLKILYIVRTNKKRSKI